MATVMPSHLRNTFKKIKSTSEWVLRLTGHSSVGAYSPLSDCQVTVKQTPVNKTYQNVQREVGNAKFRKQDVTKRVTAYHRDPIC